MRVQVPPRTRSYVHDRCGSGFCRDPLFVWIVGQREAEPTVDLGFVGPVGVVQRLTDLAYLDDETHDFLLGHAPASGWLLQARCGGGALGLGLVDPARDEHRVGSRLQRRLVLGQIRVALGDLLLRALVCPGLGGPGGFVLADGRGKRDRVELAGQP